MPPMYGEEIQLMWQGGFKNCRQYCTKNFFQAPLEILAGKSLGHGYQYWLRFWGRFPTKTSKRFSEPWGQPPGVYPRLLRNKADANVPS